MEKIKVNMSPNPLDVQTIHASQNDDEARQWGFELHNNGELIDTSDVKEQLVFKAYKGGTEQILPENGSTPTTSPFLGDIKYPQGLLADQEFTYRESPTESDGDAKITDIKGNTLVWNQLQQSASASNTVNGITYTVNSDGSVTANGTATATSIFYLPQIGQLYENHKYLAKGCPSGGTGQTYMLTFRCNNFSTVIGNDLGNGVIANGQNYNDGRLGIRIASGVTLSNAKFYPQVFDLTQMGLDITDPSDFTSLFPLSYYSYNQGTLLSFNGNGIKTVGKNLLESQNVDSLTGVTISVDNGVYTLNGASANYQQSLSTTAFTLQKGTYTLNSNGGATNIVGVQLRSVDGLTTYASSLSNASTFTLEQQTTVKFRIVVYANTTFNNYIISPQLEIGSSASDYEPYTSSTLSLPISTYFPTGMKSAGSVYDELTPNKATARLKEVTFSSVSAFDSSGKLGMLGSVADTVNITTGAEVPNNRAVLETYSLERLRNNDVNGITQFGTSFYVRLQGKTTLAEYNTYLSANPLTVIYELATPTETPITTASLVTENAEIPLSNEDGTLIGKCTEELSAEPGFHDAKIKLTDSDGTCYSNKLQLHVERSPQ